MQKRKYLIFVGRRAVKLRNILCFLGHTCMTPGKGKEKINELIQSK